MGKKNWPTLYYWKGIRLTDMTKEDLVVAMEELGEMYLEQCPFRPPQMDPQNYAHDPNS